MAIKQLKPYLKNLADVIRNRILPPNLYDKDSYPLTLNKYINPTTGNVVSSNSTSMLAGTQDYIPCSHMQGKTYTLNRCSGWTVGIAFYDENKTFTSGVTYNLNNGVGTAKTFIVPDNAYYFRFSVDSNYINEIKLEEGTKRTPYIPYGYTEPINAQDFPNKIQDVFDAGVQSEYDFFWDEFQQFGQRTNYQGGFHNWASIKYFKPKYDIKPLRCDNLFNVSSMEIDLVEYLNSIGIVLDFSNVNNTSAYTFGYTKFTHIGDVNVSNSNQINYLFYQSTKLTTVDNLWLPAYSVQKSYLANIFSGCKLLENVTINNTIYANFNLSSCPLSVESMKSIINHLYDYSKNEEALSVSAYTYTLTLSADCRAALEAEGATAEYTDSEGNTSFITWVELIDNKKWNLA